MKDFKSVTIKSLCKDFGKKKALMDFSMTFLKGEFITFLGPSGCGKSTALNCIAGLIPITSGEIYVDEECIDNADNRIPPEKREFGMVFQNYALFPHLSVFNNIAFGLQLKKIDKKTISDRVRNVLKLVHLEGYEDKYPTQLSGGEQQRVAIARCIIMEPRLLMLDEPLSNLDAKLRIDMRYELKSLHERLQITTIYVTHDQQEALALSDRIVVLKNGYIQQIGAPDEIYSRPANLFVADFMGFRNIWPVKIGNIKENGNELEIDFKVNSFSLKSINKYTEGMKRELLAAFRENKEIYTAIRPEDIQIGSGSGNSFECKVDIVEYLGQSCHVTGFLENGVRVDLRPKACNQGEKINVGITSDKILLFTGQEDNRR